MSETDTSDCSVGPRCICDKIVKRLDWIEAMLATVLRDREVDPRRRPECLPIKSVEGMQAFDNAGQNTYYEVVIYLQSIGGGTVKDAVTNALKKSIHGNVLKHYSWQGREPSRLSLCDTKILEAIYDAVKRNFRTTSKRDVESLLKMALKSSHE